MSCYTPCLKTLFNHPARTITTISTLLATIGVVTLVVISTLSLLGYVAGVGFFVSIALISTSALLLPMALGGFFLSWKLSVRKREDISNESSLPKYTYYTNNQCDNRDLERVIRAIYTQIPKGKWTTVIFSSKNIIPDTHPLRETKDFSKSLILIASYSTESPTFYLFSYFYLCSDEKTLTIKDDCKYNKCYAITLNKPGEKPPFQVTKTPTTLDHATRQACFSQDAFIAYTPDWESAENAS